MFGWLEEYLEIKHNSRERKLRLEEERNERLELCPSCEVLKTALAQEKLEKTKILEKLLALTERPTPEPERTVAPEPIEVGPRAKHVPFAVRRQMLEAEDREQARLLKEHQSKLIKIREDAARGISHLSNPPVTEVSENVRDLEKELGVTGDKDAVSSR
jgi:hypothetical protein